MTQQDIWNDNFHDFIKQSENYKRRLRSVNKSIIDYDEISFYMREYAKYKINKKNRLLYEYDDNIYYYEYLIILLE